jgi:hypothetical protein
MPRTGILPALVVLALSMCLASSADARRRHHGYYGGYGERSSPRTTLDEWRARQAQGQTGEQSRDDNRGQARGDDRTPGRAQDPQNLGQDRIQDRALDRGDYRGRYDRRRARSFEDWRRYRDYRDERRRAREEDRRDRERDDVTPTRAAASGDLAPPRSSSGAFGATIDKLVRGCAAQAAEFANWPLDPAQRA